MEENPYSIPTIKIETATIIIKRMIVAALIFWYQTIEPNLPRKDVDFIIRMVAIELNWEIEYSNDLYFLAKTTTDTLFSKGGERITILFNENIVLVNSISDPKKEDSLMICLKTQLMN